MTHDPGGAAGVERAPAAPVSRVAAMLYALVAVSALFGLSWRFGERESLAAVADLFGYFTIQSNLLVLAGAILEVRAARAGGRRVSPAFRLAITVYITVTMVIYNALLAPTLTFDSPFDTFIGHVNHTITPLLWISATFVARDGRPVRPMAPLRWLIYPAAYALFGTIEGLVTGRVRYFFLDIERLAGLAFIAWIVGVAALFAALGYAFRALYGVRHARTAA